MDQVLGDDAEGGDDNAEMGKKRKVGVWVCPRHGSSSTSAVCDSEESVHL